MKIICELMGQSHNKITIHELDSEAFGVFSDNPFPHSHFASGVIFDDQVKLTYIVNPAPKEDSCPA